MSDQLVQPVLLSSQIQDLLLAAGLACVAVLPTRLVPAGSSSDPAVKLAAKQKKTSSAPSAKETRAALLAALDQTPAVD
jgi:hypothetical protein